MTLLDPWFLLALPVVWLLFAWRLLRPRAALPTAAVGVLGGLPRTLRTRLRALPLIFQVAALSALAVALARPVTRDVMPLREKGVDIMLVVDVSSSMRATDMNDAETKTRVSAAREKALQFARARTHDRVGLVTFARYPELRCPLTLDQEALAAFLQDVDAVLPQSEEDGTGIGIALLKAVKLLEDSEATSRVVILLSDGEETIGTILPGEAAKLAKDADVRVHTIGIGKPRVIRTFLGTQEIPVDFTALEGIAKTTGGRFFAAADADELGQVYDAIDQMEKVELEDPRYRTIDWFMYPLFVAAGLFVLAMILEFCWIRGLP
ncbi:MAG: VWA domain-containing protein [Planctomycetota bacterium]|jgi:Ca-activated chloride channel family protein